MRGRDNSNRRRRDPMEESFGVRRQRVLEGVETVDYKDHELLRKCMTERGKMMPRRITGATSKQQRQVRKAIRRARVMGLLP